MIFIITPHLQPSLFCDLDMYLNTRLILLALLVKEEPVLVSTVP
jgi:hypothetical protein